MGVMHGKNGKVKLSSNAVGEITQISVEQTVETADSTAMGDAWQSHKTGIPGWSGQLTCNYDPGDTNGQEALTIGASVTLGAYLQGDGSGAAYYSGTASVTAITHSAELNGVGTVAFTFLGDGALTRSTVGA